MKKCKYCAEEIQDDAVKCRHCKSDLNQVVESNEVKKFPICQLCKGEMKKSNESKSTGLGCFLMLISVFLFFFFPVGTVIGAFLFLLGLNQATKRRGLWVCKNCGHQTERQKKWYELG